MGCGGSKEKSEPAPGAVSQKPAEAAAAPPDTTASSNGGDAAAKAAPSSSNNGAAAASAPKGDMGGLKAEAERIFKLADTNKDNVIELKELAAMRGGADAEAYARSMMKTLDLDSSGAIGVEEWLKFVQSQVDKAERVKQYSSFSARKMLQDFEKALVNPGAVVKPLASQVASSGPDKCKIVLTPSETGEVVIDMLVQPTDRGLNPLTA